MHALGFVLEILKPFMIAHLFILLMPCYCWRSAVRMYLDLQAIGNAVDFYVEEGY